MNTTLIKAEDIFLEKVNQICGKFGLNNIMAQLYAVLYLNGRPMSLSEMVDRLKISKGSVSINIRALERYGAVKQVWVKGGSRKDYYEAEEDIAKVIMERIRSMVSHRLLEVDDMVNSSYGLLDSIGKAGEPAEEPVLLFRERMEKLKALYDKSKSMFELFNVALANNALNSIAENPESAKINTAI